MYNKELTKMESRFHLVACMGTGARATLKASFTPALNVKHIYSEVLFKWSNLINKARLMIGECCLECSISSQYLLLS